MMKTMGLAVMFAMSLSLAPRVARAEEGKVKLDVVVVEVSNNGTTVDPKAARMQQAFKKRGISFTAYKVVAEPSAVVAVKASHRFTLSTGKNVVLTPTAIEKDGRIAVTAQVVGLFEMNYSLPNGGVNYLDAGKSAAGELYLMVKTTRQ